MKHLKKNELKKRLEKILDKLEMQEDEIRGVIDKLDMEKIEDEPIKPEYRTSCISLVDKKGKLLTEF